MNTSRDLSPARGAKASRPTNIRTIPAKTTPAPPKDSGDQFQSPRNQSRGPAASSAGKSSFKPAPIPSRNPASSRSFNDSVSKWSNSPARINSSDLKSPAPAFTNVPAKPTAAFVDAAVVSAGFAGASTIVFTGNDVDCVSFHGNNNWHCDDDDWSFHFGLSIGFGSHWWFGFNSWDNCWPHSSLSFHFFPGCDTWCGGPIWCHPSHCGWRPARCWSGWSCSPWHCDDFWWPHTATIIYSDYSSGPPIGPAITLSDAWNYLAEGSFSRAEDAFSDLLIVGVGGEEARVGYSIVLSLTGREASAAASMRRALRDDPQAILYVPADSRLQWPLESFLDLWSDQLAANGNDPDALFMLAAAHLMLNEPADGYFAIDQAIQAGDMDASAFNLKHLLDRAMDQRLNRRR